MCRDLCRDFWENGPRTQKEKSFQAGTGQERSVSERIKLSHTHLCRKKFKGSWGVVKTEVGLEHPRKKRGVAKILVPQKETLERATGVVIFIEAGDPHRGPVHRTAEKERTMLGRKKRLAAYWSGLVCHQTWSRALYAPPRRTNEWGTKIQEREKNFLRSPTRLRRGRRGDRGKTMKSVVENRQYWT